MYMYNMCIYQLTKLVIQVCGGIQQTGLNQSSQPAIPTLHTTEELGSHPPFIVINKYMNMHLHACMQLYV